MRNDSVLEGIKDVDDLHKGEYNSAAMAVTLSYLNRESSEVGSETRGWFDDWTDVICADGTKARVLKEPGKAFELYATEWNSKFKLIADLLDQHKLSDVCGHSMQ